MTNIICLSGFNSGLGEKYKKLKRAFPDCNVVSPNINEDPKIYFEDLKNYINGLEGDIIIVGTSLGGYYGLNLQPYITEKKVKCFLINPSYYPELTMSDRIGVKYNNYKTDKEFIVTQEYVDALVDIRMESGITRNEALLSAPNYYFSIKDEVVNHSHLISRLDRIDTNDGLKLDIKFEDQSHRFPELYQVVEDIKEYRIVNQK